MGPTAPVVKWISQRSSEPLFRVRILAGAQAKRSASEAKNLSSLCQESKDGACRFATASRGNKQTMSTDYVGRLLFRWYNALSCGISLMVE